MRLFACFRAKQRPEQRFVQIEAKFRPAAGVFDPRQATPAMLAHCPQLLQPDAPQPPPTAHRASTSTSAPSAASIVSSNDRCRNQTAPRQLQHAGQDRGAGQRAAHCVTQIAADSQQHTRSPSARHQIGHDTVCVLRRPLPRVSPRARADVFVFLQARASFTLLRGSGRRPFLIRACAKLCGYKLVRLWKAATCASSEAQVRRVQSSASAIAAHLAF
jgi:hypothetical protein